MDCMPKSASSAEVVRIYTDGACKGNPGPGGWGAVVQVAGEEKELFGGEPHTTNNRMELTAVILALEEVKRPRPGEGHTDLQYVQNGINEMLARWKRRGCRPGGHERGRNVAS